MKTWQAKRRHQEKKRITSDHLMMKYNHPQLIPSVESWCFSLPCSGGLVSPDFPRNPPVCVFSTDSSHYLICQPSEGKIHKALKMLRKKARVSHCSSLLTESQNEEDTSYGVGDNRGGNAMKSVRSLFRFPTPGKGNFAIFWFHLHANRANRSI